MAPSSLPNKRKAPDAPISPPLLKRKVQSGTTKNAVANFFTPTSQKPKERTVWSERGSDEDKPATLLVGRYEPEAGEDKKLRRLKVAAFDLDSTLIATSSGKKHAGSAMDWRWWEPRVPARLRELYEEGYRVVILSNQAGLTLHADPKSKAPKAGLAKRVSDFKQKCNAILNNLDLPVTIYAATAKDIYRKPRTGMWNELCDDYDIPTAEVDLASSFFVGDAGGRVAWLGKGQDGVSAVAKDFSCSDRNFAHNVGIDYKTPEEYFLQEKPREFLREFDLAKFPHAEHDVLRDEMRASLEKKTDKDMVLFCGPPGAGKSTFFWNHFEPLGYERINQDTLKSRDKCLKAAKEYLQDGRSVVIDNTNADPDTRASWIELACTVKVPIRCVWFKTPLHVCEHNDAVRALNKSMNPETREGLPKLAFNGFASRYKQPQLKEGFHDIIEVDFAFRGTKAEHETWARYWI